MTTYLTTFRWDGDTVIADVAGFHFIIVLIEPVVGGSYAVHLAGWDTDADNATLARDAGDTGTGEKDIRLYGRDREEAVKMVNALLGVRGVMAVDP